MKLRRIAVGGGLLVGLVVCAPAQSNSADFEYFDVKPNERTSYSNYASPYYSRPFIYTYAPRAYRRHYYYRYPRSYYYPPLYVFRHRR